MILNNLHKTKIREINRPTAHKRGDRVQQPSRQPNKEAKKEASKRKPQQEIGFKNMGFIMALLIEKASPPYALEKTPTALGPQRDLLKTELPVREVSLK